jgi:hypothetical protein
LSQHIRPRLTEVSGDEVYSNASRLIWFATGIAVTDLPSACYSIQWIPSPTYEADLAQLGDHLQGRAATIIVFTNKRSGFGARPCPRFSMIELATVLNVSVADKGEGITILRH